MELYQHVSIARHKKEAKNSKSRYHSPKTHNIREIIVIYQDSAAIRIENNRVLTTFNKKMSITVS